MDENLINIVKELSGWRLVVFFLLVLGFAWAVPAAPIVVEIVRGDVERRVSDRTREERERTLAVQSDMLALQEEYLGKLREIRAREADLADSERRLKDAQKSINQWQSDLEATKLSYEDMIVSIRNEEAK